MKSFLTFAAVAAVLCGSVAAQTITLVPGTDYCEDFEAGAGGWSDVGAGPDAWIHGAPAGTVINAAASGVNAFGIGQGGYQNNNNTALEAQFDLTAFTSDPLFAMNIWYDCENNWDGASVEIDTGSGFSKLGTVEPLWYNNTMNGSSPCFPDAWSGNSGGYVAVSHVLTGAAGTVTTIRIVFCTDGSVPAGDGVAVDDIKITKAPVIVTPGTPYCEDFEAGAGDWADVGAGPDAWIHGAPAGSVINTAASGVNAFGIGQGGYQNNNNSALEAQFDLTAFSTDPIFQMNIWYDCENNWDGASVEIDTGSGFSKLGTVEALWYNNTMNGSSPCFPDAWSGNSGGYVAVAHVLTGAAGTITTIRVVFCTDGSVPLGDGVAVDDVKITDQVASFPGTNEDLFTRYSVNGGAVAQPLNFLNDVVSLFPGDLLSVGHDSGGTWQGIGELVVLGSVDTTGTPATFILPNFWLGGLAAFAITTPILGPVQLPFGGFNYGFTNPGGGVAGFSLFLQGLVIDAGAANGNYASTALLEAELN